MNRRRSIERRAHSTGIRCAFLLSILSTAFAFSATAGSLQFWEQSAGGPGSTATFAPGIERTADLDFDADSAEGGGLLVGATEIEIRPTGSAVFLDFVCELASCTENVDYVFVPGDESQNARLLVSDPDFQPKNGIYDLGQLTFDGPVEPGTIELIGCNYTGQDAQEHSCTPFQLVRVPEPSGAAGLGVCVLWIVRRYRRQATR